MHSLNLSSRLNVWFVSSCWQLVFKFLHQLLLPTDPLPEANDSDLLTDDEEASVSGTNHIGSSIDDEKGGAVVTESSESMCRPAVHKETAKQKTSDRCSHNNMVKAMEKVTMKRKRGSGDRDLVAVEDNSPNETSNKRANLSHKVNDGEKGRKQLKRMAAYKEDDNEQEESLFQGVNDVTDKFARSPRQNSQKTARSHLEQLRDEDEEDKQPIKRRRWSKAEIESLLNFFANDLKAEKLPSTTRVKEFINSQVAKRTVPQVRSQLHNIMSGKTRT